jgi:hypothetical protein
MSTTTFPTQHRKFERVMPVAAALDGVLSLTCPTPDCGVIAVDVHVGTTGDESEIFNLDPAHVRCLVCGAPLIPHGFTKRGAV